MLVSRDDLETTLARVTAQVREPRHGIHGPSSAAWQLERDSIIFLGGGRAALLQLAHPFVAYGVDQHSRTRSDVVGRFQRTFLNVFAMAFGDLDEAMRAARRVHAIHTRVTGTLPAIGAFPAGTPYHANDVDALLWVYATLTDTVVAVTQLLRGRLPRERVEAYYRASWQFARLFGIPDERLPPDWSAFRAYVRGMVASPVLTVSEPARSMASFLFGRGDHRAQRPLAALAELVTAGLLPAPVREGFGLRWGVRQRAAYGAVVAGLRPALRVMPPQLRYLPAYIDAQRRIRGQPPSPYAAWVEQRLYALAGAVAR
jgi:uncharacterized protein (DUF2236 family)